MQVSFFFPHSMEGLPHGGPPAWWASRMVGLPHGGPPAWSAFCMVGLLHGRPSAWSAFCMVGLLHDLDSVLNLTYLEVKYKPKNIAGRSFVQGASQVNIHM
jgi:hypothetical protein